MKWPDERPCKDNTAHEKGTGYTASSACAAQVHLRERELRSFYCESVYIDRPSFEPRPLNSGFSAPTIRPLVLPRNTQQIFYASK